MAWRTYDIYSWILSNFSLCFLTALIQSGRFNFSGIWLQQTVILPTENCAIQVECIKFWDKRCQFILPIRQTLQTVRSQQNKTPNSWLGFDFGLELSLVVSQSQAIYRVSWFFSLLIIDAQIAFENCWVLVFSAGFLLVFIAVLMQIIMCKK